MPTYVSPVSWTIASVMTIEAESKEAAIQMAYDAALPTDGEYVPDSFDIAEEAIEVK